MDRSSPPAIDLRASVPNHLRLETVALDRLVFADRKLRQHPASQIRKIARSPETFGWVTPIVIDETGLVIVGRARIEAARSLGMTQAPAVSVQQLSAAEKRAYPLAGNPLAEDASWDPDALRLNTFSSQAAGFDEACGYRRVLTRDDTWRQLAMLLGHWELRGFGLWALDPDDWGRALATEGAHAALDQAAQVVDRRDPGSVIRPDNAASIRLAERLGAGHERTMTLRGSEVLVYRHRHPG